MDHIFTYRDEVLFKPCSPVEEFGVATEELAARLVGTLAGQRAYGLAANQIGVSQRALAYNAGPAFNGVIFNPEVQWYKNTALMEEGCLSIPGFFWRVERPATILVTGQDAAGNDVKLNLKRMEARIFLHEIDHLAGRLIFDLIEDEYERAQALKLADRLLFEMEKIRP